MINRILPIVVAALTLVHTPSEAQSAAIPNEARRRIAQAIWPENLFDSTGRPAPGFVRRPFRPAYADLRIRAGVLTEVLPSTRFFIGTAYPSVCDHCGTRTVVVAERGGEMRTLLEPSDIEYLADWAPVSALSDSTSLRSFVLASLRATCFLGCDVRQVRRRSDIPNVDSPFLRPEDSHAKSWKFPRTYAWQRNGGVQVEMPLWAPGDGLYEARAKFDGPGRVSISIEPLARIALF